jgi:hypothetical protein
VFICADRELLTSRPVNHTKCKPTTLKTSSEKNMKKEPADKYNNNIQVEGDVYLVTTIRGEANIYQRSVKIKYLNHEKLGLTSEQK